LVFVLIFIGPLLLWGSHRLTRSCGSGWLRLRCAGKDLGLLSTPDCAASFRVRLDLHCVLLSFRFLFVDDLPTPDCASGFRVRLDLHW